MTLKDKSKIQRLLGNIEGATFGLNEPASLFIMQTVKAIDEVLNKHKGDECENLCVRETS
jgi:hypothetical protein